MREVLSIHIGQAGIQIGEWDHAVGLMGELFRILCGTMGENNVTPGRGVWVSCFDPSLPMRLREEAVMQQRSHTGPLCPSLCIVALLLELAGYFQLQASSCYYCTQPLQHCFACPVPACQCRYWCLLTSLLGPQLLASLLTLSTRQRSHVTSCM